MIKRTGVCTWSSDMEQNCVFTHCHFPVRREKITEETWQLLDYFKKLQFSENKIHNNSSVTCKLDAIAKELKLLPNASWINPQHTSIIITTSNWVIQSTWRVLLAIKQHLMQTQWKITYEPMPFVGVAYQPTPQSSKVWLHHAMICLPSVLQ